MQPSYLGSDHYERSSVRRSCKKPCPGVLHLSLGAAFSPRALALIFAELRCSLVLCWSQPCLTDLMTWLVLGPTSFLQICVAIIELLGKTSLDQFSSCWGTMGLWPSSVCSLPPLPALLLPLTPGLPFPVEQPALLSALLPALFPDSPVPPWKRCPGKTPHILENCLQNLLRLLSFWWSRKTLKNLLHFFLSPL